LICLDLFSGAGGFSEGFRQAGFHTIAANDIDASAGATYELNHNKHGTKFVLGDISDPRVQERLFDAVGKTELDTIIGGPPLAIAGSVVILCDPSRMCAERSATRPAAACQGMTRIGGVARC